MSWWAKASAHRAYKVVGYVKSRGVYRLLTPHGVTLEHPREVLEENGYRLVKSRPAYAEEWKGVES